MASNLSDDMQEPTIDPTRKQLLALGVLGTIFDLPTFSNVQSNNTDAPEPTIKLTRKQLLLLGVPEALVDLLTFSNVQSNEPALSVDRVSACDQTEPQSAIEMSQTEVNLNDLPELPFELIFSYLSLEDRIKSRAVSRRWYDVINSFRPTSLCFSKSPRGFMFSKSHRVSGAFAQNYISSLTFGPFFQTFGQSILANLKNLRLYKLSLNAENAVVSFGQILNSFGQLEELDLFRIICSPELGAGFQVRLNLPVLKSIQLVESRAMNRITLDAPRLQNVKHFYSPKVKLVHGESVEKLIIHKLDEMEVSKMKNLKYLYCGEYSSIDSTLLSTLENLKEIHLSSKDVVSTLFQQKERYGRSNLKIFLFGFHLNAPDDPAIDFLGWNDGHLLYLVENPSKVAKEIPLRNNLKYQEIEAVAPGLEIDLLKRFTDLEIINVKEPVQDVDRFLELLQNLNIIALIFYDTDQPPELFDRLPDHYVIQWLKIGKAPADLNFLFRLKNLLRLDLSFSIDIELVRRVLEELPFLSIFDFNVLNKNFEIGIYHLANGSKRFKVSFDGEKTKVCDVNAVVQWISKSMRKRKMMGCNLN